MRVQKFLFYFFIAMVSPQTGLCFTIAIDPGHGGVDRGATNSKTAESHVVFSVSKKLEALLNNDPQFNAFLTRTDDTLVELSRRVKIGQKNQADLFLSIHANSSTDVNAQGMEIYFRNELDPDEESLLLAHQENQNHENISQRKETTGDLQSILADLKKSTSALKSYELSWHILHEWKVPFSKLRHHAIKQGPFTVVQQSIPSALVEIGFISNDKEAKRLVSDPYQKEIAQAIYRGLKDYKVTLEKGQTKALGTIQIK